VLGRVQSSQRAVGRVFALHGWPEFVHDVMAMMADEQGAHARAHTLILEGYPSVSQSVSQSVTTYSYHVRVWVVRYLRLRLLLREIGDVRPFTC
jgi:hypothetical protein